MKPIYTLIIALVILISFNNAVKSQNLFVDDFNYPVRDSLEGIGNWNPTGINTSNNVKVISPGLTYTGYSGSGIGNCVSMNNATSGGDVVYHNFTDQTTGNLYMAFMFSVDSMSSTASYGYNIGFNPMGGQTNHNTLLYIQKITSSTFNFGINKNSGTAAVYSTNTYNTNTTYLIVLKYSFVSGTNNDSVKVFIFSSGVPASEPSVPAAFSATGADVSDIGQVILSNSYAQNGLKYSSVKVDGIRVGTTWATSKLNTSVKNISSEIPDAYKLFQNYPNPFNPSTIIKFQILESRFVSLKVFDILGKEIATLVNETLQPGVYETSFSIDRLESGVYFYRLNAGNYNETKKMILMK